MKTLKDFGFVGRLAFPSVAASYLFIKSREAATREIVRTLIMHARKGGIQTTVDIKEEHITTSVNRKEEQITNTSNVTINIPWRRVASQITSLEYLNEQVYMNKDNWYETLDVFYTGIPVLDVGRPYHTPQIPPTVIEHIKKKGIYTIWRIGDGTLFSWLETKPPAETITLRQYVRPYFDASTNSVDANKWAEWKKKIPLWECIYEKSDTNARHVIEEACRKWRVSL